MSREVIVKPLGLVTRPNLYGQYEVGALSQARNMVIRAPGILETAPATVLGTSFGATGDVVHAQLSLPSTIMFSWSLAGANWRTYGNATAGTSSPAEFPTYSQTGRITPLYMRGRILVNTLERGLFVCDPDNQVVPPVFRRAGFAQAAINNVALGSAGNALPVNGCAGYTAIYKRRYSDGYVLVSAPAPVYILTNLSGGAVNPVISVNINTGAPRGIVAGDICEVYRTNLVLGATEQTDPGTTCQKIAAATITAADITASFISLVDATAPNPLGVTPGEALYTNPGQQGLINANRRPDTAACMAVFKSFLFFGNMTLRPQLIFKVTGGIASTSYAGWDTAAFRANGIGNRQVTGTSTIGSPTITGVSATHLLGIVPGQSLGSVGFFPGGTLVLSVGASTITFTTNATAPGSSSHSITDIIEINGLKMAWFSYAQGMVSAFGTALGFEVTTDQGATSGAFADGTQNQLTWILEPSFISTTVPITVRATNGQNYAAELPEITATVQTISYSPIKNLLAWSKDSQPEHVPVPNQTFVGVGEIIALESTRDALWIFCTDGLFRLSGDGGSWRVDTMDTTLVLSAPRASCVLSEVVYAYTNRGFVRITDAGVESLSERIIGDLLPGVEYTETASIIVERNEAEDEIVIRVNATEPYVYSVRENAFTTLLVADVTAMTYVRYPVSGLACLAFGRSPSGSTPRYELWNSTTNWPAANARFQPVFGGDPFSAKRWIDCAYTFAQISVGHTLVCTWNDVFNTSLLLRNSGRYYNESRGVAAVPRNAATGNTLAPGFDTFANTIPAKLYALSLRYAQNGEQQLKRR